MKKWDRIVKEQTDLDVAEVNKKLSEMDSFDHYPITDAEKIVKSFDKSLYINKKGMDDYEVEDGGEGDSDADYPIMKSLEDEDDHDTGLKLNLKIDHKGGKYHVKVAKIS